LWCCHAANCGAKGDIATLIALITNTERSVVVYDLCDRYDIEIVKTISQARVEEYHEKLLLDDGPLRQALKDRGVLEEDIRRFRLGMSGPRITIPVYDDKSRCVNIRKYLPGAPGKEKMRNERGYGQPRLYNQEDLSYNTIWICGGEMKAIVASRLLNAHGVGAVSVTGSEGSWDGLFSKKMKDKVVYICFDVDYGGKKGARAVAAQIYHHCQKVFIVDLPLDTEKYTKGDINDWVAMEGATDTDFLSAQETALEWKPEELDLKFDETAEPEDVSLTEVSQASRVGKKLRTVGQIVALDSNPYLVAKRVALSCTRDQPNCHECPVLTKDPDDKGLVEMVIHSTSRGILEMVNTSRKAQKDAVRESLGIPVCRSVRMANVREHYNVWDVRLSPEVSLGADASDPVVQPALVVGDAPESNALYQLQGRTYPSPSSQQSVFISDRTALTDDSLSTFQPDDEQLEELCLFQAGRSEELVAEKLREIYSDLSRNVTRIFQRQDLHLAIDLTYHSPLFIPLWGRVEKGWINTLICGDSSQGKSETAIRLMGHYGLGERVDCKNASVAGLVGGLENIGKRWFVVWGLIPTHDKRLVVLEEVKGAPVEIIGKLTDMRSSGIAEIPKIERRKTHARTRLVFLSNPRSDRPLSSYSYGCEVIRELMGSLEDIRRFDFAVLVSSEEIDDKEIKKSSRKQIGVPKFSAELCRRLVLWSWTRHHEDIDFLDETSDAVLDEAEKLVLQFSDSMPLLDKGTTKHKLARMAAALAARLFSTDNMHRLVVRPEHVRYAVTYLRSMYSSDHFGYDAYSESERTSSLLGDEQEIKRKITSLSYPLDFVQSMLCTSSIVPSDFCDWCDTDREEAQRIQSFFVRKRAIVRKGRSYVKSPAFIALLKRLEQSDSLRSMRLKEPEGEPF